jgi:hypothetical protein
LTAVAFEQLGAKLMGRSVAKALTTRSRNFVAWFHARPREVAITWNLLCLEGHLDDLGPNSVNPDHLLWALMFMKLYTNETVLASVAGCTEKTFRKWAWFYTEAIAKLDVKVVRLPPCFLSFFFVVVFYYFVWRCLPTLALCCHMPSRYDGTVDIAITWVIDAWLLSMALTS